jgi:hypothetical protein
MSFVTFKFVSCILQSEVITAISNFILIFNTVLGSLLFLPGFHLLLTTIIAHTVHLAMRENV